MVEGWGSLIQQIVSGIGDLICFSTSLSASFECFNLNSSITASVHLKNSFERCGNSLSSSESHLLYGGAYRFCFGSVFFIVIKTFSHKGLW